MTTHTPPTTVAFHPGGFSLLAHLPSAKGGTIAFLVGGPTSPPHFDHLSRVELSLLRTLLHEGLAALEDYREGSDD